MSVHVLRADAGRLPLRESSVACIVTSPPYNVGVAYDGVCDRHPPKAYAAMVERWAREMARVLVAGGRLWVNVPAAVPSNEAVLADARSDVSGLWRRALAGAGLGFRQPVVWEQVGGHDAACAWGSWLSPNAPNIRGRHEEILVFFKGRWCRGRVERGEELRPGEWSVITQDVWRIPCAPRNGHPAPFPEEIPRRAILLSTWRGERILDPFVGSGTTLRAARALGRVGVGCDLSAAYAQSAWRSVAQGVLL